MKTIRALLRTDGEVRELAGPVSFAEIKTLIEADTLDVVRLADGVHVMLVDDNGYETVVVEHATSEPDVTQFEFRCVRARKPVNVEATRLYHQVCQPGTTHQIVGHVVIVPDKDFER